MSTLPDKKKRGRKHIPSAVILLLILLPLIGAAVFTCYDTYRDLTAFTLERRESVANLSATTMKERLDRVIDVGISFATRVQFRNLIDSGKWSEAIAVLARVPQDFPYVDSAALFDPAGTLRAVTAADAQSAVGKNFAYRDYYQGVSKEWKPFVSEAFKRAVEPAYPVVAVTVPIKADPTADSAGKVLGILLLSIKLDTITQWAQNIDVGPGGFLYIVDRKGHVIAHPDLSLTRDVVDFSSVPAIQKALKGAHGVEVDFNPVENEERVAAFAPVLEHGWATVAVQPTRTAFIVRNKDVRSLAAIWLFIVLTVAVFMHLLLRNRALIRAERDREAAFLQGIGDAVFAIDRGFYITLWNKTASELTGYSKEEALGKPMREVVKFIRESDQKENIVFIEEAMLYGETRPMEAHTVLKRKDGSTLSVGDSAAPLWDDSGRVTGAIIVFRDISKEHDLENAREEFASLATHQLRAPITVIKGYTEMLADKASFSGEEREALGEIRKATTALIELVNAMLNVSRMESGALAITPEPVYVPDLADGVVKEMMSQVEEKKLQLEKQYGTDVPSINADQKLTDAILRNLLSNAVKYTPAGGKITLKIEKQGPNILIAVSDTGVGIPKAQRSKIFNKFFRADNVRDGSTEGTGLGLYIVRSIAEQSGGAVRFESEENKGTTFFVTIPLAGMKKREGLKGLS